MARFLYLALALLLSVGLLFALNPTSGKISEQSPSVSWTGGPKVSTAQSNCGGPDNPLCDNFKLEIVPPSFPYTVEIRLAPELADDWDLQVYGPDGKLLKGSGNSPGQPELVALVSPAAGIYTVSASPFVTKTTYTATAKIVPTQPSPPSSTEPPPTYATYPAPPDMGRKAGEPTLGVNDITGKVMYIAGLDTLRVTFDDCSSPARALWEDVSFITTSILSFDPILFMDQLLGRTFVSQLLFPTKQSSTAFSDDDGETWFPSQGAGITTGVDHQSIGGGPFPPGILQPLTDYRHAVYFAAQDLALAEAAVSQDGGVTFGPGIPMYNSTECGGIHGHLKVAPDGTVYSPNKGCGGRQAAVASTDAGLSWKVRPVPDSTAGDWDPSIGIASDGSIYMGYGAANGHAYVAVSRDRGATWSKSVDVGGAAGIENIAFPAMVAGDPDRAAFAFLGTSTTGGATGDDPSWPGVWYLYVAHTYDGGKTWTVANATPNDPVQRGTICGGGFGGCDNGTRNLLDFMDATIDKQGRILIAYADGCIGGCMAGPPNSFTAVASIARQKSGKRMFKAFDQLGVPAAPLTQAAQAPGSAAVHLKWEAPDDRGSAITQYRVYRRTGSTTPTLIATVGADIRAYDDANVAVGQTWFYQVRAVNGFGEGPGCEVPVNVIQPPPPPDTCHAPGTLVATDRAGDTPIASLDVESLSIAEPAFPDGSHKLVFTLKVRDLTSFNPGNAWFILWNRPLPDPSFDRNYVAMRATSTSTVVFKYGKVSPPSINQGTDLGDADAGTIAPDGTITITLSPSNADNVSVGKDLSGIEVRTFVANISGQPVTGLTATDTSAPSNYTLVGNAKCSANQPPIARDDSATTEENRAVQIDVLANDSDPNGDPLIITAITNPVNGKAVATRRGRIGYKPNKGFTGVDAFTYTISDGKGGNATATVRVTVKPR